MPKCRTQHQIRNKQTWKVGFMEMGESEQKQDDTENRYLQKHQETNNKTKVLQNKCQFTLTIVSVIRCRYCA